METTTVDEATEVEEAAELVAERLQVEIARAELIRVLQIAGRAIPVRTSLAALTHVLITASSDGTIEFRTTDLDKSVRVWAKGNVVAQGQVLLPLKRLAEVAREMPPATITVSEMARNKVKVKAEKAVFTLNGLDRTEFPGGPKVDFTVATGWSMSGDGLAEAIERVGFAASTEESRPTLNGILFDTTEGLSMVATNGHRLASIWMPVTVDGVWKAIVPTMLAKSVAGIMDKSRNVQIQISETMIGFKDVDSGTEIVGRQVEGPYPNYQQVIPKDSDKFLEMAKADLGASLKRVGVVSTDAANRVRLKLTEKTVEFSVAGSDSDHASDEADCVYRGDPMEIGFNSSYVSEVLKHLRGETVMVELRHSDRAVILKGSEPELGGGNYFVLVMPLRLID